MEPTLSSSDPSLPDDHAELFRLRIRALYRQRLALIRDAVTAQIDLLRFGLEELELAHQAELAAPLSERQVTENDANAHSSSPQDLSSLSERSTGALHPTLVRRVRGDALKLISLSDELDTTLQVVEGNLDVVPEFDLSQTLLHICGNDFLANEGSVRSPNLGCASSLSLVTPPPEPLDVLVNRALAVEPSFRSAKAHLSDADIVPDSQPSSTRLVDRVAERGRDQVEGSGKTPVVRHADPVASFFAEEFRVLRFSEDGEISFQNRSVLASLRKWQLLRPQELNPPSTVHGHRTNYSESDHGLRKRQSHDKWEEHSADGVVGRLHPNRLDCSGTPPIRLRFPFFQTRTYLLKNGYVPDELRVTEAAWSGDLISESPSNAMPDGSNELRAPEGEWVGDLTFSESQGNPDFLNSKSALLSPEDDSWQDSWQSTAASTYSARDPVHGYGYNGFRVDTPSNIKVISNFQKRTFIRLEPEPEARDREAPFQNGHTPLTNPLDFLFRDLAISRGSNTDSNSSPAAMQVSDPQLADEVSEVFNINRDGTLCIKQPR